jgi:transcriptional regulator with XRE-family HTH domain
MPARRKGRYDHHHRTNAEKEKRARAIGRRLVQRREELGLKVKELAERCGWDASRIWKYETGHAIPSHEAIECLSRELGLSRDLLSGIAAGTVPIDDEEEDEPAAVAAGAA